MLFRVLTEATKPKAQRDPASHTTGSQKAAQRSAGEWPSFMAFFQNRKRLATEGQSSFPSTPRYCQDQRRSAHEISPCPVSLLLSEHESVALGEEAASDPYSSTSTSVRDVITRSSLFIPPPDGASPVPMSPMSQYPSVKKDLPHGLLFGKINDVVRVVEPEETYYHYSCLTYLLYSAVYTI